MNEFLKNFSDRNSLLYNKEISSSKTTIERIKDSISWVLNDSSSSIDKENLGECGVFHPEKSFNMSYWMFLEFIKFVRLNDKQEYIDFIVEKAILMIKNWRIDDEGGLKNLSFCLSSWLLTRDEFEKAFKYYLIVNKNNIYNFANRCMLSYNIEPKHEALTTILWAIDEIVWENFKPKNGFKKEPCVKYIKNMSIHKATHKTQAPFYIDEICNQLVDWDFNFYKELILLYTVEND